MAPMNAQRGAADSQLTELVDKIKLDIIFGRLRPRERLIEDDLSARFGASRHLVRSAFAELQQMGLVTRRPNKGVIVRDFSPREVDEIYEMRAVLQREAASRIPLPADPGLVRDLEAIHAEYCAEVERHNLKRVCELNNAFHRRMFEASNNRCLADLIQRIWTETLGIRCYAIGDPDLLRRSREDHAAMLEALKRGDRESLVRLCVEHIWPALEAYKRAHGGWPMEPPAADAPRLSVAAGR
jgi:DNA-binding GntR family transcriptional regulator